MSKSIVAAIIGWIYMLVGAFNILAAFVPELQVYVCSVHLCSFQIAQYVGFGLMSFLNISILFIGALMIPIGFAVWRTWKAGWWVMFGVQVASLLGTAFVAFQASASGVAVIQTFIPPIVNFFLILILIGKKGTFGKRGPMGEH